MIIIKRQKVISENGHISLCYITKYTKKIIEFLEKTIWKLGHVLEK